MKCGRRRFPAGFIIRRRNDRVPHLLHDRFVPERTALRRRICSSIPCMRLPHEVIPAEKIRMGVSGFRGVVPCAVNMIP